MKFSHFNLCIHLCIGLYLILIFCSINVKASNLPDLGASDLKEYDSQTETELGRAFSTALYQHYDLVKDPIILSYVRRIGAKIIAETGENRHFSFQVINNDEINAFAGPNGVIGIHTGLIMAAESEDELASVIAHEIAHVTLRHLSRTYEYQSSVSVSSIATLIAAILVGSQNPSAGLATYIGGMGLNIQNQLKNSRIHEAEADYIGIKYLNNAGYNPHAMAKFFGRLEQERQVYGASPPEILLTHPVTQTRLAKSADRAFKIASPNTGFINKTLRLIQLRIASLPNKPKIDKDALQQLNLSNSESCYLQNLSKDKNLNCLKKAIKLNPQERIYKIQLANQTALNNPNESEKKFKYLIELYPNDFSLPYYYATMLQTKNKSNEAIKLLTDKTPNFFYQDTLYTKLALLYANIGNKSKSYYYEALASFNIGNLKKSLHLTKQAKKIEQDKKTQFYISLDRLEKNIIKLLPDK